MAQIASTWDSATPSISTISSSAIQRAVLPRVLSIAQVEQVTEKTQVEIEVFGFGSLCVMVEGRCALSSYTTGESPNTHGVCSPARYVRWQETPEGLESRLNGVLIDRYDANENAGYPTLCKGRFDVAGENYYALEEPTSLNTLELLPQLMAMGVRAVKIEGRQRSPAYVAQVTRVWRRALDHVAANAARYSVHPAWSEELDKVSEGQQQTLGAYHRPRVQTLQFYEAVREWPVDMVYLGETVCSRRHELRFQDWLEVADMLNDAGKNVVLSTQVLLMDVLKPGRVLSTLLRHAA